MSKPHLPLLEVIKKKISISPNEENLLISSFTPLNKDKNDLLISVGGKSQALYFIVEGYIRCFHYDHQGNEITTNLLTANSFVTSFESFQKNTISKENIQCITNCGLLKLPKGNYNSLFKEIEEWPRFCQNVYEDFIIQISKRLNILQNLNATEKYENLLASSPHIALHTPVKYLASYLGIQPQSLSRIRKTIK